MHIDRRHGWLVAAAAFSICAMVTAAATIAPDDEPTAAAAESAPATRPLAGRFLDRLDTGALDEAARAVKTPDEPVDPPVDAPEVGATDTSGESETTPPAPAPRRTAARPRPRGSSQFLAALVKRTPSRAPGTLVARARGGTCRFWIDGVVSGEGRVVKVPATPGAHNVACRGPDGRPRVQRVNVLPGGIAVAAFHLGD